MRYQEQQVLDLMCKLDGAERATCLVSGLVNWQTQQRRSLAEDATSSVPVACCKLHFTAVGMLRYIQYSHALEHQYLPEIRSLISKDLSEPYSIYVYRYFLCNWPELCFMVSPRIVVNTQAPYIDCIAFINPEQALDANDSALIGVVVCRLGSHDPHSAMSPTTFRGYIAMLAVVESHRGKGIATSLVLEAISAMQRQGADEVVLETEDTNLSAMRLYQRLGFLRSKKLHRYYLNGNSAYRLILPLGPGHNHERVVVDSTESFFADGDVN